MNAFWGEKYETLEARGSARRVRRSIENSRGSQRVKKYGVNVRRRKFHAVGERDDLRGGWNMVGIVEGAD